MNEQDIALGVMQVAASRSDGVATFKRCRAKLPDILPFSQDDNALSGTRPGETMWHQQVRNIRSHHDADGNAVEKGYLEHLPKRCYRITDAGRTHLKARKLHP